MGNPYHDELGRFDDAPAGAKGFGGKAKKAALRAHGKRDWKRLTPAAQTMIVKHYAKDLAKQPLSKAKATRDAKRAFGKESWSNLTPAAKVRNVKAFQKPYPKNW